LPRQTSFEPAHLRGLHQRGLDREFFAQRSMRRGSACAPARPYQFVPLIMSLRQAPVRLLIADDVGVGKTIEAAMIARELLDRGLAQRLAVLCPAHLSDQWERTGS